LGACEVLNNLGLAFWKQSDTSTAVGPGRHAALPARTVPNESLECASSASL
jgi:hypothetical protein